VLAETGIPAEAAEQALRALFLAAIGNLRRQHGAVSLTGPILRGDVDTIRRHLVALADDPGALEVYRSLSRALMPIACKPFERCWTELPAYGFTNDPVRCIVWRASRTRSPSRGAYAGNHPATRAGNRAAARRARRHHRESVSRSCRAIGRGGSLSLSTRNGLAQQQLARGRRPR